MFPCNVFLQQLHEVAATVTATLILKYDQSSFDMMYLYVYSLYICYQYIWIILHTPKNFSILILVADILLQFFREETLKP